MSVLVSDIELESEEPAIAIDIASHWLQNDPDSRFHAVVDNQDMIEERCLLIRAHIETSEESIAGYVGFCTVRICDEFVELYRLYVAPDFRRMGIARQAVTLFAEYVSKQGFSDFYIEVTHKDALEFWDVAAQNFIVTQAGHMKYRLTFEPNAL